MNERLFKAILAMDSYNRGYGVGIDLEPFGIGSEIGGATIILDSENLGFIDGSETVRKDIDVSFYALAYSYDSQVTISYRGTDNIPLDALNGFLVGGGDYDEPQAALAFDFYRAVVGVSNDPYAAAISVTGHSLGGGLAGLVGAKSGDDVIVAGGGNDIIYGGVESQTDTVSPLDGRDTYIARSLGVDGSVPFDTITVVENSLNKKTVVINGGETDVLYSVENVFANRQDALNSIDFRNKTNGIELRDMLPTEREQLNDQFKDLNGGLDLLNSAVQVANNGYGNFGTFVGTNFNDTFTLNQSIGRTFNGGLGTDNL